jgi:uncharacterized repeat protein (TIGR01451 family)
MKKIVLIFLIVLVQQSSLFTQTLTPFTSSNISPFNQQFLISRVIDFDNDGDDDIFGWNNNILSSTRLYQNNGNMTFTDVSTNFNFPIYNFGNTADLDKNGLMDVYYIYGDTLRYSLNLGTSFTNPNLSCGQFIISNLFNTSSSNLRSIKIGDYNNDGIYDLFAIVVNTGNNSASVFVKSGQLNCGNCGYSFSSSQATNIITFNNQLDPQLSLADLNGDGSFDILIANGTQNTPYPAGYYNFNYFVYLNNGLGQFSQVSNTGLNLGRANAFGSLGELNNDGIVDVFSGSADCCVGGTGGANNINPLYTFLSSSSLNYLSSTTAMTRASDRKYYNRPSVFDVNLDKKQDVLWTDIYAYAYSSSALQCYINNGNNTLTESSSSLGINLGTSPAAVLHTSMVSTALDVNNDKKIDLNIQSFGTYNGVFHNNYTMMNNSANNSVKLKLDACQGLKEGWGARIKYKTGGTWSHQQHTAYSGSNYPFLYLGMANATTIDSLVIYWMGGAISTLTNIPAGSYQVVSESNTCSSSNISLSIYNDVNQNCISDNEIGIEGIEVILNPGNYVAVSNSSGYVIFNNVPDGNYTALIDTTNLNWSTSCSISQTLSIQNGVADCIGFGLTNNNPCTDPDVSIYAPFLRRCLPNQKVYVSACNQTTATGVLNASYVDVELDPLMTVTSASLPYTAQGNNIYRFQTGNLNPGQCASFNITTTISCNALLGQTLCMDANLYPVESCALDTEPTPMATGVTPCNLPWDQSSLSVDGWCQGDSVYFTITNTGELGGGDMECYSPVRVYVDGVLTYFDSIMIQGGTTVTYSYFGNGQTWILQADQHPLHPGNSHPNAHVEACGDVSNWTPDLVNDFPQDDADPVVDIYCGVVTGSYDPNDKTGFPLGIGQSHDILPNTDLQYVIRFQNTGTDTAFTVVIRDTLDTDLNIFTVTPGVSSHPYTFRMYGPRVLEWTFENINLPDSSSNEPESHGFATFQVKQVPNLATGTEINNEVGIYFDLNDPIITNTTLHTINPCINSISQNTNSTAFSCDSYTASNGQVYTTSGTYQVISQDANGCNSINNVSLTISDYQATATLIGVNSIQASPGVSYQWINCATGQPLSSATNPIITVIDGEFAVIVNNGECSDTSNCVTVNTSGLEEGELVLNLHPNPSNGIMVIEAQGVADHNFVIYSMEGRQLQAGTLINGLSVLDLQSFANGTYIFQTGRKQIRFVIQK